MNLSERALSAYQTYGAERLEKLKDPAHTLDALERVLNIVEGIMLYRDDQGIVLALVDELYFYYADEKLHTLLRMQGEGAAVWNPCEDLVALGRIIAMQRGGQLELLTPPQLNPL